MSNTKKPNLAQDVEKRYKNRINSKKLYDETVDLSAKQPDTGTLKLAATSESSNEGYVRLLDEGHIMDQAGRPSLYIKKGVLKQMVKNLSADRVGEVTWAHTDPTSVPTIVGTWTKKDLKLVDIGNGRQGLDVKLHLDDESVFIKELKRQQEKYGVDVGVSIEMATNYDWSEDGYGAVGVPVVDKAEMLRYSLVGEAGNATSGGIKLATEGDTDTMGILEKLKATYGKEETKTETKELNTDEKIELSTTDYDQIVEKLAAIQEFNEKEASMISLMTTMDERIKELEAENLELKAEKVDGEKIVEQAAKQERSATALLEKLSTATKVLDDEHKAKEEKGAVLLGVGRRAKEDGKHAWERIAEDGIGGDL